MKYLSVFCLVFLAMACSHTVDTEQLAFRILEQSRSHLALKNYGAARDSIISLRTNYPTAIKARRSAILLLDSVEMLAAQDSVEMLSRGLIPGDDEGKEWKRLTVKAQFFERKLYEDLKR